MQTIFKSERTKTDGFEDQGNLVSRAVLIAADGGDLTYGTERGSVGETVREK